MYVCAHVCVHVRERDVLVWGLLKQIVGSCPQFLLQWVLDRAENLHFSQGDAVLLAQGPYLNMKSQRPPDEPEIPDGK